MNSGLVSVSFINVHIVVSRLSRRIKKQHGKEKAIYSKALLSPRTNRYKLTMNILSFKLKDGFQLRGESNSKATFP